ncbi:MAG: hypothetical protein EP343_30370 [Deltaproteobacteria bacterium]|nr:MAG: hypothetical protein EP343_30370 [Deltaproteobacteria bacterium]
MKALQHSAAQQTFGNSVFTQQSPQQNGRKERSGGQSTGFDAQSAYEQMSSDDLPGVGLGQSFQQSMEGFDTNEQSAGVAMIQAERQRRLQSDIRTSMVRGVARGQATGQVAATSSTGLDAYKARIQGGNRVGGTQSASRAEFERRMEERLEAIMAAQGISTDTPVEPEVKLPSSPWDVEFQRSDAASSMGFHQYNYSTAPEPDALPRVGI